jgi:chromosome segregation protein
LFLSSLEILGFKSFARKTVFRFPPGITAIVGPNGCGKTNVVDAIRWVLGEQRAGILRSERMENVIFNGSASAPPLGMAEVSITLQNTRNILPIEFSEVKVTRRLFRSGESQYLLNDAPCRLKDIQNLFLDTGLAPDAYSVIELAMIEQILNGRADERRRLLEEAAGVGKYKARRRAAFSKLEATEADLLRLNDLITEVERNVRSLQAQVRRAEKAREIQEELREKDLLLSGIRLHRLLSEESPLRARLEEIRRERERLRARIELEESELEQMRLELAEAESRLAEAQHKANERAAQARSLEKNLLVLRERARSTEDSLGRLARELTELDIRSRRIHEERETAREQLAQAERRNAEVEQKLQRAEEERRKALQARESARGRLTEAQSRLAEAERRWTQLEIETGKLSAQLEAFRRELTQREQLAARSAQELRSAHQARVPLAEALKKTEIELEKARKEGEELRLRVEEKQTELAELRKAELELAAELERSKQQLASLERLLQTYEDRPEALRLVVSSERLRERVVAPLTDLLSVPQDLSRAIAAALGPAEHALLVKDLDAALEGVNLLIEQKGGTAIFLSLSGSPTSQPRPEVRGDGVLGWASELVDCPVELRPAVEMLLGRVLLVETAEVAHRLVASLPEGDFTVVTREGTLIRGRTLVQGGYAAVDPHALFDRRNRLEVLRQEVETLGSRYQQLVNKRKDSEAELEKLEALRVAAEKNLTELDRTANRLRLELEQVQRRQEELSHSLEENGRILAEIGGQRDQIESQLRKLASQRAELETSLNEQRSLVGQLRAQFEEREKELQVCEGSYQQIRLEKIRVTTEMEGLRGQLERLERERAEVQELVRRRRAEEEELKKRLASTQAAIQSAEQDLGAALERKEAADRKVDTAQRHCTERRNRIAQRQEVLRHLTADHDRLSEEAHQLELRIAEIRLRAESLQNRARETWQVELEPVDRPDLDPETLEQEVGELREKLERIGPVNALALEEYAQMRNRLDFLTSQRDDLLQAKDNLVETIRQINHTARQRFMETFETVRKNFAVVFQSFFEGGETDLRLSDPSDPLESEIEILARPRGKRIETLSLLSGGEKALTALSFLFAIYLVKPSPFCILDEVDAPLDDANVEHFIKALRKFAETTQFIVVTHNKLTMKAADALYGVTMQRDGVSKVVSVRFEEEELVENAA